MQHDQLIWETIQKSCAFKRKLSERSFCGNAYNVTGLCNRVSCPLANSKYATVREEKARCYLYVKSVERAHSPRNLWAKIKWPPKSVGCEVCGCRLSKNYQKALKQIDSELEYWPEIVIHRNKQRLTKIFQSLLRIKKLSALPRPRMVPLQRNVEKVDRRRETRAETVARIENAIEDELMKRLQSGVYGDIYNFPMHQYNQALEREVKKAREVDLNTDEFQEMASEEEEEIEVEYLEDADFEASDDDIEDLNPEVRKRPTQIRPTIDHEDTDDDDHPGKFKTIRPSRNQRKRKKPRLELEIEKEFETMRQTNTLGSL